MQTRTKFLVELKLLSKATFELIQQSQKIEKFRGYRYHYVGVTIEFSEGECAMVRRHTNT